MTMDYNPKTLDWSRTGSIDPWDRPHCAEAATEIGADNNGDSVDEYDDDMNKSEPKARAWFWRLYIAAVLVAVAYGLSLLPI